MGYYSKEDIDEVADLVEIAIAFGHNPIKRGNRWKMHCPFHDDDRPSLDIYVNRNGGVLPQKWTCWSYCNETGSVYSFVAKELNLDISKDFYKVCEWLGEFYNLPTKENNQIKRKKRFPFKEEELNLIGLSNKRYFFKNEKGEVIKAPRLSELYEEEKNVALDMIINKATEAENTSRKLVTIAYGHYVRDNSEFSRELGKALIKKANIIFEIKERAKELKKSH